MHVDVRNQVDRERGEDVLGDFNLVGHLPFCVFAFTTSKLGVIELTDCLRRSVYETTVFSACDRASPLHHPGFISSASYLVRHDMLRVFR